MIAGPTPGAGTVRRPRLGGVLRRLCTAAVLLLTAEFAVPLAPAQAHPLGPPQQVSLALSAPNQVQATWKAGADDDLSWLAYDLGLLPTDRIMLDGAVTPEASDGDLLRDSPRFDDYLIKHMIVDTPSGSCPATLVDKSDPRTTGATLRFTCPAPVTRATVMLSLLTDLEASYATVATGPDGQTAAYTGASPSHDFIFDPARITAVAPVSAGPPVAVWLGLVVLIPGALGGAAWLWRRNSATRKVSA